MRLNEDRVRAAMNKAGITEEMLPDICGIHSVNSDFIISPMRARRFAKILKVNVAEIVIEDYEGEVQNGLSEN